MYAEAVGSACNARVRGSESSSEPNDSERDSLVGVAAEAADQEVRPGADRKLAWGRAAMGTALHYDVLHHQLT